MSATKAVYSLVALCVPALLFQEERTVYAAEVTPVVQESLFQKVVELSEQIDEISGRIVEIESDVGPYDRSLLEPLRDLASVNIEMGDFNEVDSILERRLQIIRTSEGPESLNQIAVVEDLVSNDLRRQDWQSISNRFEFLQDLYSQNVQAGQDSVLRSKYDVTLWKFNQLYLDQPNRKIRHFQEGREVLRRTVDLAEDLYGVDSMELVPWLYRDAILKFQVASVILADDELGVDARDEILRREGRSGPLDCVNSTLVGGDQLVLNELDIAYSPPSCRRSFTRRRQSVFNGGAGESYLREGLNTLERIAEISRANGELEAEAMAITYESDFRLLMDLSRAATGYRRAMDRFIEAGVSSEKVEEFFQRPVVLPEPNFQFSIADAIRKQDADGFRIETVDRDQVVFIDLGRFPAWSDSLPFARRPELPEAASNLESIVSFHEIEMEFSLNSQGYTRNPDIVQSTTDSSRIRRDAREALRTMRFRPYFVDRDWEKVDSVRIRYQIPED